MLRVESLGAVTAFGIVIYFSFLQAPLTCPGIFEPRVFRSNGSSKLRSNDQASEVYRRADGSDLAGADRAPVAEVAKRYVVSEPSIYAWRTAFGLGFVPGSNKLLVA